MRTRNTDWACYTCKEATPLSKVPQRDDVEAKFWFRMAAAQGHPRAQYRLHRMYEDGEGGDQDPSAAAHWEAKAWRTDPRAQCALATACRDKGADEEAEFWYRGAAYRGDVNAQFELGAMYWDGWAEGKIVGAAVELSLTWVRGTGCRRIDLGWCVPGGNH